MVCEGVGWFKGLLFGKYGVKLLSAYIVEGLPNCALSGTYAVTHSLSLVMDLN